MHEARGVENICTLEARLGDTCCAPSLLAAVMRHFSSPQFVDVLRSVVRGTVASGVDAKGPLLHKVRQEAHSTTFVRFTFGEGGCSLFEFEISYLLSAKGRFITPTVQYEHFAVHNVSLSLGYMV